MKKTTWIMLSLALVLFGGCAAQEETQHEAAAQPETEVEVQERYEIAVGTDGFDPAIVHAKVGEPVTLVFTRTTEETCGTEVMVKAQDINMPLPLNEPVEITLVPDEAGEIDYSCGMEMLRGKIVVN
jgi:plastocyanin domain-containing protein